MIKQNRRNYIASIANIVRDAFDITTPVTEQNFRDIIQALGGTLEYKSNMIYDAKIERVGEYFNVSVNSNSVINRQRFSIAHELGHLFLHMKRLDKNYWENHVVEDSSYFRYGRGIEEIEADEFAGAFLMPQDEFREKFNEFNGNYQLLSDYFQVSEPATYVRSNNLSLNNEDLIYG